MVDVGSLISGFRTFKATEYEHYKDMVIHAVRLNEVPKTIVIACCDMRMAPGKIFSSNPGELFVIRNLGAYVPEYNASVVNATVSAINYAVAEFNAENIIVIGHANCHSMHSLLSGNRDNMTEAVRQWLEIGIEAREAVVNQLQDKSEEEQELALMQESVLVSLKHLLSYPEIAQRVKGDKLKLFGWYFDITKGQLRAFNPQTKQFELIE